MASQEKVESISLPLPTDVALAELLIYKSSFGKYNGNIVVRRRRLDDAGWHDAEEPWQFQTFYCWHDVHEHCGIPVVLPLVYDDRRERFAAMGRFCSFPCAIKFVHERQGFFNSYVCMLATLLSHKVFGFPIDTKFHAAPCRQSLRLFGNDGPASMNIKEFRNSTHTTSFRKPPFLTPARVNQDSTWTAHCPSEVQKESIKTVMIYQSWDTGYVFVSSFTDNMAKQHTAPRSVCWYDTEPFEWEGIGIPMSLNTSDEDFDAIPTYTVYGCFCSIPCALSYLMEVRDWNVDVQMVLTHAMAKEVYRYKGIIEPAPVIYELEKFGGSLTLEEFRRLVAINVKDRSEPIRSSNILWESVAVEHYSKTLPENFTTLRNQSIAVSETFEDKSVDGNTEGVRALYEQFVAQRRAELREKTELMESESSSKLAKQEHASTNGRPANSVNRPPRVRRNATSSSDSGTGMSSLSQFLRKPANKRQQVNRPAASATQ